MNLTNFIYEIVKEKPNNIAIIEENNEMTYKFLWEKIEELARGCLEIGIKEGDRVVVILPNSKEFVFFFLALLKIGTIVVPLQPIYTNREYKEFFEEVAPTYIVTTTYILTKVLAYESSFLEKYKFIISDDAPWIRLKYKEIINFNDLINLGKSKEGSRISITDNLIASINYTYRGYGYPLGVVLTHENYLASVEMISSLDWPGKRFLTVLPMAHIFSLVSYVIMPLLKGFTIVILRIHAAWEFLKAIEEHKIEIIYGVPTFYSYLLKAFDKSKFDISSIKCAISGGSYLSGDLQKELEQKLGIKFFQGYGLTEGLIVSSNNYLKNKYGSLGPPVDGIKVKIITDNKEDETNIGVKGEIAARGPNVMLGYYKKDKETKDVLKDGWLYTGDLGRMDDDEFLYFLGYKKNIAKVGGQCVDLKEIEKILMTHPYVYNTKVYSEQDSFWGDTIVAEIFTGKKISEEEILNFCNGRLAIYKIPKKIKLVSKEGAHILILDAEAESRKLYSNILQERGYNVTTVDMAYEAIEAIKSGFYDVLICDLGPPDKKGKELLDKIRKTNDNLPIIVITGYPSLLSSDSSMEANVIGCLVKPILPAVLISKVENVLNKNKT